MHSLKNLLIQESVQLKAFSFIWIELIEMSAQLKILGRLVSLL